MQAIKFLLLIGCASAVQVTPVQKVIQLLQGMLDKGKEEKHAEQVQFASYRQFCDDTAVEKKRAIAEANEQIEMLEADIEKFTADAARLTKEIAVHDGDIAAWEGDRKAATKVRGFEKDDYDKLHKDYSESIDALGGAIKVLKKQAKDRKQMAESSFAQVSSLKSLNLIPPETKRVIDAFFQDPEEEVISAPEAAGYEFQSHGIIDMLEKLLNKFVEERTSIENSERNSVHEYNLLQQDMKAQITQATDDRTKKAEFKANKIEAKAKAQGDVEDTTATRDADQKYLNDVTAECAQKASDFESRQQLRAEEIVAVSKAIEILSSDDVTGNAEKHLPKLIQKPSLAQVRSDSQDGVQAHVAEYLRQRAQVLNSKILAMAAVRVQADPFAKVKKMIKDLLVRLMEEANEEAEHKGWCDTELSTNEQVRKEKTDAVEMLHAEKDELVASLAKLAEEIQDLTQGIAELDSAMAKATEIRQEEKATNTETIADSKVAQTAVAQAVTVLKEFYEKAGGATVFVQKPQIFDRPYKGLQAENGGVVGMLEVIQSDFARLESDTKAAEASAQKAYDNFMTDSKADKEAKQTDIEHKETKKQDEAQALVITREDLEGTQEELDAALAYFDKLKPSCVDAGVSYKDRVDRRQEEIDSLQDALKILNGDTDF